MRPEKLQAKLDALTKQLEGDITKFEKETGERISGIKFGPRRDGSENHVLSLVPTLTRNGVGMDARPRIPARFSSVACASSWLVCCSVLGSKPPRRWPRRTLPGSFTET